MAQLPSFLTRCMPILTAATPGAFRVFVITFAMFLLAGEEAVLFSTQYALVSFFIMICGVGFSTVLVKEMAVREDVGVLFSYGSSSIFVGGLISGISIYVASFFLLVPDLKQVLLLTVVSSVYQVFRNYLIFKKDFFKLLVNDVLVGVAFLALYFSLFVMGIEVDSAALFLLLSFSYFLACAFILCWRGVGSYDSYTRVSFFLLKNNDIASSLIIGFSNAASGGVSFILPSLFAATGGEEIAIVASIAALVFSSVAAVPRGVVNNAMAQLSKMISETKADELLIFSLRKKVKKIIAILFPVLTVFIYMYLFFLDDIVNYVAAGLFVITLGFYIASAQFGVVESVMVNLCGYERLAFYFNLFIFALVVTSFVLVGFFDLGLLEVYAVYTLPLVLGVVNIFRMYWYRRKVSDYFDS
ncbi:hypothetical protein R0J87_16500 [Halomonas sp. SIMBA_159]